MKHLTDLFGSDISNIILSKLCYHMCTFENCYRESSMLNRYCRKHWCADGHPTNKKKHRGYCSGCFSIIIKTDNKKYLSLVTRNTNRY
jgi:hypothetical protein